MSEEKGKKALEILMEEYERFYLELQPKIQQLEGIKDAIKANVLEHGETVSRGKVRATYRKGYSRTYWDSKGLDGFAVAHPEIRELRTVKEYGPSVSVSVRKGS